MKTSNATTAHYILDTEEKTVAIASRIASNGQPINPAIVQVYHCPVRHDVAVFKEWPRLYYSGKTYLSYPIFVHEQRQGVKL